MAKYSIRLRIGPDEQTDEGPGVAYCLEIDRGNGDGFEAHASGGWRGPGPKRRTPIGWLNYAARHMAAPTYRGAGSRVRRVRWCDALTTPDGYSQGAGHAPQGVTISWDVERQ